MELLFVLAPIYWLPGVSDGLILLVKLALLGLGAYLTLIPPDYILRLTFTGVSVFLVFIVALGIDLTLYFVHGDVDLKFLFIFGFISLGFVYYKKIGEYSFFLKVTRIAIVFSFFPLVLVVDSLAFGGIIYNSRVGIPAYMTGFHGGRTGWSFVLGVFLAVILSGAIKRSGLLTWAVVLIYAYAIYISGSRGGVLMVLALFALFLAFKYGLIKGGAIYLGGMAVLGVCLAISLAGVTEIESRILQSIFAPEQLHTASLTGGRLEGFEAAIQIFLRDPIWGGGEVNLEDYGFAYQSIHNVWLKTLVERGVVGLVAILLVTMVLFVKLFVGGKLAGWLLIVFAAGYLPTLYEPTAIFGNFWSTSMFWFLIGAGLASREYKEENRLDLHSGIPC